jgi:putative phosphoribosyl transferase
MGRFRDRRDAGRQLAAALESLRPERPVLLALPRGGVPVAHEVARALGAPLDVLVVRKLGAPRQPELGVGAIGEGGVRIVSSELLAATVAAPVAPRDTADALAAESDGVVLVKSPSTFAAIGEWYDDFTQVTDAEVVELLDAAFDRGTRHEEAEVRLGPVVLPGTFTLPPIPLGVVVFAHGSGSSRLSPRNRYVAGRLVQAGLGAFLLDLLTPDEEIEQAQVFDVELLAARLHAACEWVRSDPAAAGLPIGLFGASTGAAAALTAAADDPAIGAVVSRGGRPDLAPGALARVHAPTLFVVGGADELVLERNRWAAGQLGGEHRVDVVAGAGHLFEEEGALEQVAALATAWFACHLSRT